MASDGKLDLSIVIPIHNEIDNLDDLVRRMHATLEASNLTWELVAVDDGSDDGSSEALDDLARREPALVVLHLDRRHGQSAALDAGFKHSRGALVGLIDADLQTFPEDFPTLIETLKREDLDAVVGIRAERQDHWWKRASSIIANGVRNRITREDIVDTGCPLKVFRREAILAVTMFDGMHRFLPTLIRMHGFTVAQVPVRHTRRNAGISKYGTWDRAFKGLRDALAVRWMQRRRLTWRLR